MKKLFTLLTLFILVTLTASAADEVYYTLTCSKGSNSAYASYKDVTINGMTWNAPGNQNLGNYWRIGFKEIITNGERTITAKSAMGSEISKIVISHNGLNSAANVTLNSVKVTVASDADFSSNIEEVTISNPSIKQSTAGTFEFNPSTGITWSKDAFYKFTFNFTTNATSAKAIDLTKIEFYKSTSTSGKTATTLSFGSDWDGKEITKYIGEADFTCPTATLTPAVEGATITYSSSDENVAAIVDGTIMLGDAGTTTISASYAGNDNYEASSASFTINLKELPNPTISHASGEVEAGTEVTITAPAIDGATIEVSYEPEGEATVDVKDVTTTTITITKPTYLIANTVYNGVKSAGIKANYTIKAALSSIAISGSPTKTTYTTGDSFSTDGLTVTATYSDGSTADVTSNVSWSFDPATFATEGSKTVEVTATYNGKTATENYTVTVTAPSVSTNTYTLVTSADQLVSGAEYVLLTSDGARAASTFNSSSKKINTVAAGDNTFSLVDDVVTTYSTSVNVLTIAASDTKWTITDQDGVKFSSSGDKTDISNGSGTFTISVGNDGVVTIVGISDRLWLSNGSVIGNYSSNNANTSGYYKLKLYKSGGVALPAKPTFDQEDGTTFTESLKVTITPAEGCKVKYQLGEAEVVTATDTNPVEVTLTETTTITAWSVNDENVESNPNSATYTKVEPFESKTFTLVTSTENIVDGEYVLVSADGTKAASVLGSELTTVAVGDNTFSLSDDGVVTTLGESVNVFTLTKNGEGKFTITDKDGKKLESSSTANSIKATTDGGTFDISINSKGNVVISGYTNYLWKHNTSADYIRNYKTTSTTDVQFLKLYKAGEVVEKPATHVKNIAEFMALEENTTAIFDNPVVVLYDYSQPSLKKTDGQYLSNPEYIWVKDESGQTNLYLEEAIDPTNHQAKYENGDVIPAGFKAVKNYFSDGKFYQALVDIDNKSLLVDASHKRLADPVTITFDVFNGLVTGVSEKALADSAQWSNTYVMIQNVTMTADASDKWGKTYFVYQDDVKATSNVFYNKYSDTRNDTEIPHTKQGEDGRVSMPSDGDTKAYNVYGILQVYNGKWEIMPIRFVEYSAQTVTLKELVEAGNAGTTTEGTEYTILNDLRGVVALPGNVILAKDENGNAVGKVTPAGKSFMITAKSYFSDDTTESVNAKAQEDYDQSNWVEIVLPSGVSASDYVDKIITGLSVKGQYTDTTNPRLVTSATPAAGGATGAYTRNAMCPANFMGTSQACNSDENHGSYFFMTPKPNECVQVVWAVYNSTAKAFYIPQAEGSINTHGFKGAFGIDWTYNTGGEITGLQDGGLYQFKAVVKKQAPAAQSGKRRIGYDASQDLSTDYLVYPLNLTNNVVTGITEATGAKTVKSVRYFNIMGVELAEPAAGVNIVLTTYTDGSTRSQKILR